MLCDVIQVQLWTEGTEERGVKHMKLVNKGELIIRTGLRRKNENTRPTRPT